MSEPILRIQNLSHRYTSQWAVKDISIEISNNEVLGLLGSNGAGKSTTMNILCGVINQTKGEVFINGIDLRKHPTEAKRQIGFLPQKPPVYPDLAVEEYLTHTAHLRLVPRATIQSAVDTVMEKCGLTHVRKRLIGNLSGGYQQRVGIAQAVIHEPRLVVFDEPTTGLDPINMAEVRKLIKEISRDRAVIFCTHILTEAQAVCDTIKMIEKGRLVFSGTKAEFNDYVKPNTLIVRFLNRPDTAVLSSLESVTAATLLDECSFAVQFSEREAATSAIVSASVSGNWQLSEIYMERQSLDLIFAELSREAAAE